MPCTNTIGANTATVVRVEAVIAPATSRTPRTAAVRSESPSSRQRVIDSSTTIALSTSMPTPSARPPSDMMLSETSPTYIGAKVTTTEIGIEIAMIAVGTSWRRKARITTTARIEPMTAELLTSSTAARMNVDWSESSSMRASRR